MEIAKPDWKSFSLRRRLKVDEWLKSKGISSYKELKAWCEEQGMTPPAPGEVSFPKKETKSSTTTKKTTSSSKKKTTKRKTTTATKPDPEPEPANEEKKEEKEEEEKPLDTPDL